MSDVSPSRVLRRALEEALEKHVASTVLFESLGAASGVPRTVEDVLAVVRGPLREVLARRLDPDSTEGLLARIEEQLRPYDPTTVELPLDTVVEPSRDGVDATVQMPTQDAAVPVLVLAAGSGFAGRLQLSLGEARVDARAAHDAEGFRAEVASEAPAIVLVDGTDFPKVDARDVVALFEELPTTTARVLWGAELPFGQRVRELVGEEAQGWVILPLEEGIPPLLDLVRSRRSLRRSVS